MKSHVLTIQLKAIDQDLFFLFCLFVWGGGQVGVGNFEKHSKNTICDYEVFKTLQWLIYTVCKFFMIFGKIIT